jgi:hypothetical protein
MTVQTQINDQNTTQNMSMEYAMQDAPEQYLADPVMEITSPEDATKFCDQLADTIDALISVLDEESRMVREAKLDDAAVVHARKSALAANYGERLNMLKSNAEAIRLHTMTGIEKLRSRQLGLESALQTNMTVLATARMVAETLIRGVQSDAAEANGGPTTYSATGYTAQARPEQAAISINAAV